MKYTPDQLRMMARQVLRARDAADPRWIILVTNLSLRTGLPIAESERRIEALAQ